MKLTLEALRGSAVGVDVLAKITGGTKSFCHADHVKDVPATRDNLRPKI